MKSLILSSQSQATPPMELSDPQQALWWLKKGNLKLGDEWEAAHLICQAHEGTKEYDWVHALAHWIEGDMGNADYWYSRVGEDKHGVDTATEWEYLAENLA